MQAVAAPASAPCESLLMSKEHVISFADNIDVDTGGGSGECALKPTQKTYRKMSKQERVNTAIDAYQRSRIVNDV